MEDNARTNDPAGTTDIAERPLGPVSMADAIGLKTLRGGVMTSLDPANVEDRKILYSAMMGESQKADAFINQPLLVRDVVLSPASSTDAETGEIQSWVRTVLVLADGSRIAFGSLGILKSLAFYSMCYSPPPWIPAVELVLKSTPIGKNRWYTLEAPERAPVTRQGKPR